MAQGSGRNPKPLIIEKYMLNHVFNLFSILICKSMN